MASDTVTVATGLAREERRAALTALFLSTLAFLVCFACWVINGVLVTYLVTAGIFSFTRAEVGWLLAVPFLTGSITRVPLGVATDLYGGRLVLTLVMLVSAVPLFLMSQAETYAHFLLAGLGFGIAGGGFAVGVGYVAAWFKKEHKGTALGVFGMGNAGAALTTLAAPALLVWLTDGGASAEGWRALPKVYAAVLVAAAVIFFAFTRERIDVSSNQSIAERMAPLKSMRVWRFGAYYFLVFGGFVAIAQWLIPYTVNVYHVSIITAGLLASVFSLPSGAIRAIGGWLSDRFGARAVMYWVFLISALSCVYLAIPRMDIDSPGAGVTAMRPGPVESVSRDAIVVAGLTYRLTPPVDKKPASLDTGTMWLPRITAWQEPVVARGDTVIKGQLLARGTTNIYYPANLWLFAFFVLVFGIATGIGKSGVYKFIPDYFPGNVGTVAGMVGLLGALGGFVLPPVFGYLLDATGVWATCWLLLGAIAVACLIWMQRVVRGILQSEAPELDRLVEFRPRTAVPTGAEVVDKASIEELLHQVPIFADLTPEALTSLAANGRYDAARPGQMLFREGDPGNALYVVIKGEVRLSRRDPAGQEVALATMRPGMVFGELALIDGEPRSATAVAVGVCGFFIIERDDFMKLLSSSPRILGDLMVGMSGKIRETNTEYFNAILAQERLRAEGEVERHRLVTQMVAGVAHEINTPIGVANQAASLITDQLTPAGAATLAKDDRAKQDLEDLAHAAKLVQDNLARADRLIRAFKNLSVHQASEARETVDLVKLTEEVIGLIAIKARLAKLELELENTIAGDAAWDGYPGSYTQIFLNLIGNVERYAYPPGEGGKVTVKLERAAGGKNYRVTVRDYGKGIPAADLKKVWEPFFTTGRGQGGSGLGLAIVRNLATTSLKGRVDIESKVGEGTAVIVEFPRALPDPAPGSAAAAPAVATATP